MIRKTRFFLLCAILLFTAFLAHCGEDAFSIIKRVEEKQSVDTSKSKLSMLVFPDAGDQKNVRTFTVLSYSQGEEDSYMEFLSPRTIKGLKLLSKGDDQWVYFSSTGRCRKIASSSKSKKQSVKGVGGDFSYEDLGGGKLEEKYSFKIRKEDKKEWVLEGMPKKEDSVYSKIVIYVNKSNYMILKIEYYTEDEGHYKDLRTDEVKIMGGRETATHMTMLNHDKGSKTIVVIHSAEYDIPLSDKYFNPARFYK